MQFGALKARAADIVARFTLRHPGAERALHAVSRSAKWRERLKIGAVPIAYSRVARQREERIAVLDGYRIFVNVAEHIGIVPYFFGRDGTAAFLRDVVRPGDAVFDIGANAGHYTMRLATLVGAKGRVVAFEPNPVYAEMLERSIKLNGFGDRIRLERVALSSEDHARAKFFVSVDPTNSGTSSLIDHGWGTRADHAIEVETRTFDSILDELGIGRLRFAKIDVEHAEAIVLSGAKRTLAERRVDYFFIESRARSEAEKIMLNAGYGAYWMTPSRALVNADAAPEGAFGDFLFVHPDCKKPRLGA